ncbi:hypothetical protein K438DRAFT_2077969 [Mycena galopus ATCC 62051]|nr:hypothetical protein K438DRAFT_2077969 [Mycena galopus ATCC 62051]
MQKVPFSVHATNPWATSDNILSPPYRIQVYAKIIPSLTCEIAARPPFSRRWHFARPVECVRERQVPQGVPHLLRPNEASNITGIAYTVVRDVEKEVSHPARAGPGDQHTDMLAIPPVSCIKIRVTLVLVHEDRRVEVLWDTQSEVREFKWGAVIMGQTSLPTTRPSTKHMTITAAPDGAIISNQCTRQRAMSKPNPSHTTLTACSSTSTGAGYESTGAAYPLVTSAQPAANTTISASPRSAASRAAPAAPSMYYVPMNLYYAGPQPWSSPPPMASLGPSSPALSSNPITPAPNPTPAQVDAAMQVVPLDDTPNTTSHKHP